MIILYGALLTLTPIAIICAILWAGARAVNRGRAAPAMPDLDPSPLVTASTRRVDQLVAEMAAAWGFQRSAPDRLDVQEEAARAATRAALDRIEHALSMRLTMWLERRLRLLRTPQESRAWLHLASGEYRIVGVRA